MSTHTQLFSNGDIAAARAEIALWPHLFSFEVLAPGADSVRCRRAAVRRAGVRCLGSDGLRLWCSGHLTFGGFIGQRLHRLNWRARGQVRAGADGASSPALLANVRAVP